MDFFFSELVVFSASRMNLLSYLTGVRTLNLYSFHGFFCLLFVLYVNGIIEHVLLNMQLDKLTNALNVSEKNRKGLIQQFRKSKKQIKYLKNSNAVLWAEIWQQAAHMSEKERSELSQRILLNTQIKEVVKNGRLQNRKNNR